MGDLAWAQMVLGLLLEHGLQYEDVIDRMRLDQSYMLAYRIWKYGGSNADIWRQLKRAIGTR